MPKNVAVLFSGAKDSTFAIYKAINMGMNVKYLVTILPKSDESYMFHHPNVRWTKLHAEAMGIPLITKETEGKEGEELNDMRDVLASIKPEIQGVVTGALESRYQKSRIDSLCRQLGLESISPHWERGMKNYLKELLVTGFEVIITAVAAEGLDQSWLGRRLDEKAIADLEKLSDKHGVHMGGEGGEYESFVLDGPIFRKRIRILKAHKEWDGARGALVIDEAELVSK
jgi:ABC transporter with metal-binding/Fe-S-binding domain ATP-binding protein